MTDSKSKLTDLKDLLKPLPSELSEGDKQHAYDLYFAHQTQSFHKYSNEEERFLLLCHLICNLASTDTITEIRERAYRDALDKTANAVKKQAVETYAPQGKGIFACLTSDHRLVWCSSRNNLAQQVRNSALGEFLTGPIFIPLSDIDYAAFMSVLDSLD